MNTYTSEGNKIYYHHPFDQTKELFLTVHKIKDSTKSPAEAAEVLAELLNEET